MNFEAFKEVIFEVEVFWVVMLWEDTDVSEVHAGWGQHGPLKRRNPTTAIHGVTTQRPRLGFLFLL
jgi:hypothetical protein